MKICICGGGSIGHVVAGTLASKGYEVNVLTGNPEKWQKEITVFLPNNKSIKGELHKISNDPKTVIKEADYILLCVPGFLIDETLKKIKPYLKPNAIVGSMVSSNGFFWMAKSILSSDNPYFGFQRVPFIARVNEYGHSAYLKGHKQLLKVAINGNVDKETVKNDLHTFFDTPVEVLKTIWPAALTNSNPILHTARLYTLFKDFTENITYPEEPLFYEGWDLESAKLLIACDEEFQKTIKEMPFKVSEIPPLLEYYESHDAHSLTHKLQNIVAFKGIRLKMRKTKNGFVPDWKDRYFSEDIPFGLLIIRAMADFYKITTPNIDRILLWAQDKMGKEYIIDGKLKGKDIFETGIPQNYTESMRELINN